MDRRDETPRYIADIHLGACSGVPDRRTSLISAIYLGDLSRHLQRRPREYEPVPRLERLDGLTRL